MKIYPSKHKVISTKKIDKNFDIPLAYIDGDSTELKVDIKTAANNNEEKKMVLPYDSFDNLDIKLFNEYGEEIKTIDLLRRNDKTKKYYYIPKHSISYKPQRFNYSILAEKSLIYSLSQIYNIKITCTDINFIKHIIQIFGDAPKRNLCPSNIYINNQDTIPMNFLNNEIKGDIIFILSEDGIHYKNTTTKINYKQYLDNNVNVWVISNYFENFKFIKDNKSTNYILKNPILYKKNKTYNFNNVLSKDLISDPNNYINSNIETTLETINLFNNNNFPIGLNKYNKKGIVAFSSQEIFDNIKDNTDLIYETLMYIYCNSYIKSIPINTWVSDIQPDYIVENGKIIKKERLENPINASKIFSLPENQINICDITTDAENILIDDITNNFVVFKKNTSKKYDSYKDGFVKPEGAKTIFTSRQDIICYNDFIYLYNDDIKDKIKYTIQNDKVYLKIKPFKHSLKGINIKEPCILELPLYKIKNYKENKINKINYYLCCKDNVFKAIESSNYKTEDGNKIAEILIHKDIVSPKVIDIRKRGGGSAKDDFDLLDVGNILGRPYRKAGAFIITLPEKYKKYDELIKQAIDKHKVGEEVAIILYENE